MQELVFLLLASLGELLLQVLGSDAAADSWRASVRGRRLRVVAAKLGLTVKGEWQLVGRLAEADVVLTPDDDCVAARVEVAATRWKLPLLALRHRAGPTTPAAAGLTTSQLTGDHQFDAEIEAHGSAIMLAALDSDLRLLVRDNLPRDISIDDRGLTGSLQLLGPGARVKLVRLVRRMVDLAKVLDTGDVEVVDRLQHNALHDPVASVRLSCLGVLTSDFARNAATAHSCRHALADPEVEVRLHAALALERDGVDELARIAGSSAVTDAHRIAAIEPLARLAPERARPLLRQLLVTSSSGELLSAALTRADTLGLDDARELLASRLADLPPQAATEIAAQVGVDRARSVEPLLIARLQTTSGHDQRCLVRVLAEVGSATALTPLAELAGASPSVKASEAHQAMERIRERLDPAVRDRLTGRLSTLTPGADHGGLSIADPPGQLSQAAPPRVQP